MIKRAIILVLLLFSVKSVIAQQDAQYTQYMYNTLSVNPAYAGSRGVFSAAFLYRSQWLGLEGAPKSQTLNLHAPMGRLRNMGYGISVVNDKIGPTQETYFDVDFSYSVDLSYNTKLSFGLKAGGHLMDINYSELNQNPDYLGLDVRLLGDIKNKFSPNIGAGVYLHSDTFYVGLSAPNLIETEHFEESSTSLTTAKELINLYLITGYVWELNPDLYFKPAILTKAVTGAPLQMDFSTSFLIKEKFTIGAAYRWDAAFSGFTGFQFSDKIMVGLAYDKDTTELGQARFNDGSFEFFVRFELIDNLDRIITPRFF